MTTTFISGYPIDVVTRFEPKYTSKVASDPVESGAQLNDHVSRQPFEVAIEGVISDTPLFDVVSFRNLSDNDVAQIVNGGPTLPSREARDTFDQLWKDGEPFEIVRPDRLYKSVVITDLAFPDDSSLGAALRFAMTVQEIRIVDVQRAALVVQQGHKGATTLNGKIVQWNWATPPGSEHKPSDPVEFIYWDLKRKHYYYSKQPRRRIGKVPVRPTDPEWLQLTIEEVQAFTLDMQRDARDKLIDTVQGSGGGNGLPSIVTLSNRIDAKIKYGLSYPDKIRDDPQALGRKLPPHVSAPTRFITP